MKKLSVLFVAAVVALSASAGVSFKATHSLKTNKINTEKVKVADVKKKVSIRGFKDQPAGETKYYSHGGQGVYVSGGYLTAGELSGKTDIVYAEDGKVYIKNLLNNSAEQYDENWVEGYIEGNELHIPMGQSIYWSDYYEADVVLAMGTTAVEGTSLSFTVDESAEEAIFVIDGETLTLQGTYANPTGSDYPEYEGYGLGCYWTDDLSFGGFNEWNTVLTEREPVETPTVITELPDGCETFKFMRFGYCLYNSSWFGIGMTEIDGDLYIAFNEDATKAYIQNPLWWMDSYGTWVEGDFDVNTGIITVPVGQFLTWSDEAEYGVQLMWGNSYVYLDTDENGEEGYYLGTALDERAEEIQFQVSLDFKTIDILNCEGNVDAEFPENYECAGLYGIWSDDLSWAGALEFTSEGQHMGQLLEINPVQPANPTVDEWYDCGSEGGFSRLYFTLPKVDVNGEAIDPTLLSYSIFLDDDQIFAFPYEDYYYNFDDFGITEDLTEIPYEIATSGYDFNAGYVYFYRTNAEGFDPLFTWRIGMQCYYNVDGEKFASDIVYLEVFPHEEPVDPHMEGYWLVAIDANGEEVWYQMTEGNNGDYTTTLALDYDTFGYVYYDAHNPGERHNVDYYIMIDGVRYGAADAEVATVLGTALDNELVEGEGFYTLPVGYNYNMGVAISPDGEQYFVYAAQAGFTGVDELNAGKTVANVRYFNAMGQEMAQPEGVTIAVTTYTDGTTSAVKVVK